MNKETILNLLEKTKSCGYTVVGIVCDLGGGNRSFLNELGIHEEKPWFMFDNEKIYSFADAPHLIKLLRNHFLDEGFIINGKVVNKGIVFKLLEVTSDDLTVTNKISVANLTVSGAKRQKVKLATKLFSHTISQAISRAASLGFLDGFNWSECQKLFKIVNDWFDVMNSRVPRADSRTRCHAYGLALREQDEILESMTMLVKEMRAVGRTILPFQRGIIQSNNAVKAMLIDLKARYDVKFILTYRLNQDILENFFGIIRSKGGLHDHPDQQQFKYRLLSYILRRNDGLLSENANVEVDDTPDLQMTEKSLTGMILKGFNTKSANTESDDNEELKDLEYDGLEHLAGYICHGLAHNHPEISVPRTQTEASYSWIDHVSEGGLKKPTEEMMIYIQELNKIFEKFNKDNLLITEGFLATHMREASAIKCSDHIKTLFFRARMYFKIRTLNRQLEENSKKTLNKMKKIVK